MKTNPFSLPRLILWPFSSAPAVPGSVLDSVRPASRRSFHPRVWTKARRLEACTTVAEKVGEDAGTSVEIWVKRLACVLALLFVLSLVVSGAWATMLIVDSLCRAHVKSQFQVFVTQRECPATVHASQNDSGFRE